MLLELIGIIVGTALLSSVDWDEIIEWLEDNIRKLENAWKEIREYLDYKYRIFGDMVVEAAKRIIKIIHKIFYKKDNEWYEETTVREIPESEVPEHIRRKMRANRWVDITDEIPLEV